MPPATTRTRRDSTLPTMRCAIRVGNVGELPAHNQDCRAGEAATGFFQEGTCRNVDRALRVDCDILTGIAGEGVCDGDAITWPDECLQAVEQRPSGVRVVEFEVCQHPWRRRWQGFRWRF